METYNFNPDIVLGHSERGQVAATVGSDGYRIINRLMRSEVDKFFVDLINTGTEYPESILSRHMLAKAAAQFYQGITDRINHEIQQYTAAIRDTSAPVDVTDGLIDLGPQQSNFEDLANDAFLSEGFLEEGNLDE